MPQDRRRLIIIGVREDLGVDPSHPPAETWPLPVRIALEAANLRDGEAFEPADWEVPELDDAYGKLWPRVRVGGEAADVLGKGFGSCVKPDPARPAPTLPKTQTGRGFATIVHPFEPRALSAAEAALIGTYPPGFRFAGTYQERWARIGNGVPPLLMRAIARHVGEQVLRCAVAEERAQLGEAA